MPPRRKAPSATDEHQAADNACKFEESYGKVRQDRGAGKDTNRPGIGGDDEQEQLEEPQQGSMANGRRQVSRRRGSNASTPGQATKVLPTQVPNSIRKIAQSSLKAERELECLSAQVDHTQTATRPELKQDQQALNLRSSSRTRKLVCYNEQSPTQPSNKKPPTDSKPQANAPAKRNASSVLSLSVCYNEQSPSQTSNKKPPIAPKPKGNAPAKRTASSALLLSGGAKRVKEDPTSIKVETLTTTPTTICHAKRGRTRDQKLKLPQSHDGANSAAVMNPDKTLLLQQKLALSPATASHMERVGTRDRGLKLLQSHVDVNSAAVVNSDKMLLLQTAPRMRTTRRREQNGVTATPLEALEGEISVAAITQEKRSNMSSTRNAKVNSDNTALAQRKKRTSKKVTSATQEQETVEESSSLKLFSMAAREGNAQDLSASEAVDEKSIQVQKLDGLEGKTLKEKTGKSRKMAMANAAQDTEVNVETEEMCGIAPSMKEDDSQLATENAAQITKVDVKVCGIAKSADADRKIHTKVGRKTVTRKEILTGVQVDKEGNADAEIVIGNGLLPQKGSVKVDTEGHANAEFAIGHDLLLTVRKGRVGESIDVDKNLQLQTQGKGKETDTRKRTSFTTRGGKSGNATVLENSEIGNGHDHKLDAESLGGIQESTNAGKSLQCQTRGKGRKTATRMKTLPTTRGDETENATVSKSHSALVKNDHRSIPDRRAEEFCGTNEPSYGGRKLRVETQQKENNSAFKKRTLQGGLGNQGASDVQVRNVHNFTAMDDHCSIPVTKPEEICGTRVSTNGDKKLHAENEMSSASRKRTLQGVLNNQEQKMEMPLIQGASDAQVNDVHDSTAMDGQAQTRGRSTAKRTMFRSTHYAKKLKMSGSPRLDTLPSTQKLVRVDTQDWIATDVTNCKVDGSSEKKRKEEGKRKRARKFDALPVGFGLGISCWSPSPRKLQQLELNEATILSEERDATINSQAQLMYPLGEAEKQPFLQEIAMLEDADDAVLRSKDMNTQPVNIHVLLNSATEKQESSMAQSVSMRVCAIGPDFTTDKSENSPGGKAKIKKQIGGRTKKANTSLVASTQAVPKSCGDNMVDGEKLEPGNDVLTIKMQQSFGTGAATRSKRTTRSTKQ